MPSNDRITFTIYPLWLVWLGRVLLYLALLMAPAVLAAWLSEQAPASMKPAAQITANVVLLPLLYVGLYWLLRHWGARAQNFIWLVIAFFGFLTWSQGRKAATDGDWSHWLGAGLGVLYVVGFASLAVWGWRRNHRDRQARWAAERQAQVDLHAEAILRAQALDRQRSDSMHASAPERTP
ncbi:hypothetical protein [Lysobacter sp. FW306-1B-D06B]|uniref:hypothetical protein n=1 Tax=Lysobacter sp. FW306-1B-D06B TaxID=3140250 RepID=UPI0031404CC6